MLTNRNMIIMSIYFILMGIGILYYSTTEAFSQDLQLISDTLDGTYISSREVINTKEQFRVTYYSQETDYSDINLPLPVFQATIINKDQAVAESLLLDTLNSNNIK